MEYGTVTWYNESRGEGSIACDSGRAIRVTHSSIECEGFKILHEGERVTFDIVGTAQGPAAARVKPCDV